MREEAGASHLASANCKTLSAHAIKALSLAVIPSSFGVFSLARLISIFDLLVEYVTVARIYLTS